MRKITCALLALIMLFSLPFTSAATELSTEQKFSVLKQKGIFSGFPDGTSRLYESMTREQFAVILYKLLELQTVTAAPKYNDVLKSRWSYDEIQAVTNAGLMAGVGNRNFAPTDTVTVEQLAVVLIRAYGFSGVGTTPVYGKVSDWARNAISLALDRNLLTARNDYSVIATRGLLVETAYAVYEDVYVEPLRIQSIVPLNNQTLKVSLYQKAVSADKSRFVLKDVFGNNVGIQWTALSPDGLSVTVMTDRQVDLRTYTLYVNGGAWGYVALPMDTAKPQIISFASLPYRIIEVIFQEPVEADSVRQAANYSLSSNLKLANIQLASDQRKVTLTTTQQTDGIRYRLTIRGLKDLSGNVMDTRDDLYFVGNNDITKPKVTAVNVNNDATITVTYSEKINAQSAVVTSYYNIDKGLYVTGATLEQDGQTVRLTTSAQRDATVYNLTITNVLDLAGNVIDPTTNWLFGGVANPAIAAKLQAISTINQNTVDVSFNRTLTDGDVSALQITILTDNGAAVSMSGWSKFVQRKAGSDKAVTVQFRTGASNPNLFLPGHIYLASVTGISGLVTANNGNRLPFAGTEAQNRAPFVTQVIPLSRTSIKVLFSEPVKNVSETAFTIQDQVGPSIRIDDDELNNTGIIVTEVILRLSDSLAPNKIYVMSFQRGITDAAGWNELQTNNGSQPVTVLFGGI